MIPPRPGGKNWRQRLELNLDRPVGDLSKGNRQKVAVICAFQHQPEVLVLDEPTAGLDPLMRQAVSGLNSGSGGRGGSRPSIIPRPQRGVGRLRPAPPSCGKASLVEVAPIARSSQQGEHRLKIWFVNGTLVPDVPTDRLPGVRVIERQPGMLHFAHQGTADAILKWIAQFPVDRIATPQTSLEEAFIQYYRQPSSTSVRTAKGARP